MKIIIGADFIPTKSNIQNFNRENIAKIVDSEIIKLIHSADYKIFNLEAPITEQLNPIEKCGPVFSIPKSCIEGYESFNIDLFTLANNHIYDQGDVGVENTIRILTENNISFLGISKSTDELEDGYIAEVGNKKIGIYACCEHEFSVANKNQRGATPFNEAETYIRISRLSAICDFVIVLYHGGKEHYRFPSPNLQTVCRGFVNNGANLVICQHSHCIGCEEFYNDERIIYGQGNFLFDNSKNPHWQTGLLIELSDDFELNYIPVVKAGNGVRLASKDEADKIMSDFFARSKYIENESHIYTEYEHLAEKNIDGFLLALNGHRSFVYRILNKVLFKRLDKYKIKKYGKKELLMIKNLIECETHRELLIKGIDSKLDNIK